MLHVALHVINTDHSPCAATARAQFSHTVAIVSSSHAQTPAQVKQLLRTPASNLYMESLAKKAGVTLSGRKDGKKPGGAKPNVDMEKRKKENSKKQMKAKSKKKGSSSSDSHSDEELSPAVSH